MAGCPGTWGVAESWVVGAAMEAATLGTKRQRLNKVLWEAEQGQGRAGDRRAMSPSMEVEKGGHS